MNLTLHYEDGGVRKALDLAVDSLKDLAPILRRFAKWMRPEVDAVFAAQGPGWAPRADDSPTTREGAQERIAEAARARGQQKLRLKLRQDLRRAQRRLASGKGKEKTVDGRYVALKELERIAAGGSKDYSLLSGRKGEKLRERLGRAESDAEKEQGQVLGRIAGSIKARVQGSTLEIYSSIPWAGIHNEGGTAGRGAKIPARTFLEWTPVRVEKLASIASEYMHEKLTK